MTSTVTEVLMVHEIKGEDFITVWRKRNGQTTKASMPLHTLVLYF
jgi:hypothetical protein